MATRRINLVPGGDLPKLLGYWAQLDRLYAGFADAARRVQAATGQPICVPGCGICCQHNTVHVYGAEAEYAASFLLGDPPMLRLALDACREWLTKPGKWTYGKSIDSESWGALVKSGELMAALTEDCPFLLADKRCMVHAGRPSACRAYGVTRLPGHECPRPIGINEGAGADGKAEGRCWWDAHDPALPLYEMYQQTMCGITEPRYQRQGFLPTMIFERFRAQELAGYLDDGKVPLVKMAFGVGPGYMLLWQQEMEATWSAIAADLSIASQVPLVESDGRLVMRVGGS